MSPTETTLLSLALWTLVLVMSLGTLRTILVLTKGRAANSFDPTGNDLEGLGKRLTRAHANCYEFLPIAGLILLYAIATGQTTVTNGLAYVFLGARIAQSLVHIISTSNNFVLIRFGFFGVQLIVLIIWLFKLLKIF